MSDSVKSDMYELKEMLACLNFECEEVYGNSNCSCVCKMQGLLIDGTTKA